MLTHNQRGKSFCTALIAASSALGLSSAAISAPLVGLTNSNSVISFDSASPNSILVANNKALFGFEGVNETAVSIDRRPVPGTPLTVLTVGQVDGDDTSIVGRLYDLDASTGLLTNARVLTASFSTSVLYTIDFNPTGPVALRIIGSDNSNYRVANPSVSGATTVDPALSGDGAPAVGVAYSNNDNDPGTGTTIYYVDRTGDRLATSAAPNGGVTTEFANALGVDLSNTGFQEIDIAGSGVAYGVFQRQGENFSRLYTLDLTTGAATATAADNRLRIGNAVNLTVRGIAASPVIVPETGTMVLLTAGLTLGGFLVRRRKTSK